MITPTTTSSPSAAASDVARYSPYERPNARISWGSVFAGAVIALAAQIVFVLIGLAIGLATLDPATGESPSGPALGIGGAIWLLLSTLLSLFLGGYIAARLAGRFNGWLHGLTTWGTLTLATLMLLTSAAGQLIGAASGLTNFAVSNSDKASRVQLPSGIQQQVDQLQTQASQSADQATTRAQATDPAIREAQARDAGQKAATGGAVGTGAAALAMILGALAAAFGGKVGQRNLRNGSFEYDPDDAHDNDHRSTRVGTTRVT